VNATYTVQATQGDTAGNVGTATSTFVVDVVAPVNVTVTAPIASSVNPSTPTISGTAGVIAASSTTSADQATVTVVIYRGSGTGGSIAQSLTANVVSGGYTVTASPLTSGTYTVRTTQNDGAGNSTNSNTRIFTVDATAPVVTVSSPANNSYPNGTTPTFSGTATAADLATVTIRIYTGSSTAGTLVQTLTTAKSGSAWSATPTTPLAGNAQYTVQASQSDAVGNIGLSNTRTFVIDTTAPANVSVTQPTNGQTGVDRGPIITGTGGTVAASSTSSVDGTVTVRVYAGIGTGGTQEYTKAVSVSGAGTWSVDLPNNTLSSNTFHTVVVTQTDGAGNSTSSVQVTFHT
jgi:hypothetical protein